MMETGPTSGARTSGCVQEEGHEDACVDSTLCTSSAHIQPMPMLLQLCHPGIMATLRALAGC